MKNLSVSCGQDQQDNMGIEEFRTVNETPKEFVNCVNFLSYNVYTAWVLFPCQPIWLYLHFRRDRKSDQLLGIGSTEKGSLIHIR